MPTYRHSDGREAYAESGSARNQFLIDNGYVLVPGTGEPNLPPSNGGSSSGSNSSGSIPSGNPSVPGWLNTLYQTYFGRNANPAEATEWSKKTAQELEQFMVDEFHKYRPNDTIPGSVYLPPTDSRYTSPQAGSSASGNAGSSGGAGAGTGTDTTDTTGWPQSLIDLWDTMSSWFQQQVDSGNQVNPDLTIDPTMMGDFLNQAHTELGPYYDQIFQLGRQDLDKGFQRLSEDYGIKEAEIARQYGLNIEATQENYARRGLNMSSDRTNAEQKLADAATRSLDATLLDTERRSLDLGQTGERYLGSQNFTTNSRNLLTGATPILNRPGVYGMTQSSNNRSLFNTQGNITGEVQRNQLFDEQHRVNELVTAERERRGTQYI